VGIQYDKEHKAMRNSEYMAVLAEAIECVRETMADRRLPDLTPEQMAWWFQTITVSDVETLMTRRALYSNLEVIWRKAA
jgi:hypothetical protein